jgi:predicted TIM-barrel fold metal-dependent hydrolase
MESFDGRSCGLDGLAALAKEADIGLSVVMPDADDYRPNNSGLHESTKDRPEFVGVADVNPHFGKEMVEEVRTAATDWGFRGIKFMPLKRDFVCTDAILKPFMDLARELGLYLTVHTGPNESQPVKVRPLAAGYPEVPILLDHMGMRSWVKQAIDLAEAYSNVYLLTTVVAAAEPFRVRIAVDALGPERVIFGSNSPVSIPAMNVEGIRRLKLGREAEALIFHENARRVLRLDA